MQNISKYLSGLAIVAIIFVACDKKYDYKATYNTDLSGQTNIKVFNATLNAARNYVYVGTTPLNGAAIAYGGVFPASNAYSSLPAGTINLVIKDTLPSSTQLPLNFSNNFEAGKFYSIFTYDTLTATKYKIVTDQIVVPTDSSIRFRFANFFYSSTPVNGVDIFSFKSNANIATNVLTNDVTAFNNYPYRSDTLYFRATGTTTELIKYFYTGFTSTRSYTVVMRGRYQNTSGAVTRAISTLINY